MPTSHASQDPEYLKVEEVAARLKVQERTVRDWILRGELQAYKIGKEWRIRRTLGPRRRLIPALWPTSQRGGAV